MAGQFEYRVTWQREGRSKRARIYQTRAAAEGLLDVLRTSHPDEPPPDAGHVVGETGVDWTDAELERWERMTAPFVVEPRLEARLVGGWSPLPERSEICQRCLATKPKGKQ